MKQTVKKAQVHYSFALFLLLSNSLTLNGQQDKTQQQHKIEPGKRQATLILSNGQKVELSATDSLNYTHTKSPANKVDSVLPPFNKSNITTQSLDNP